MTTNWWWIRHGPTHEKSFVGWRDVPADLSDLSRIKRLKKILPKNPIMLSSDLQRATATANAINSYDKKILISPDLREFNFGVWDGMEFEAVSSRDPTLSRDFWENPGDILAPEGESWNILKNRVSSVVDKYTRNYLGADIIAVAHFGVILTQLQIALGITPYKAISYKIDNLSVTKISIDSEKRLVNGINMTP